MLKSGEQFLEELKSRKPVVYILGERVNDLTNHPVLKPSIRALMKTYDLALDPKYSDVMTATSHITGEKVNRFNHVAVSREDLVKRIELMRMWQHEVCACTMRCPGNAAINALYDITYRIDQKYGTDYHKRFVEHLKEIQKRDLSVGGALTDSAGNRALPPSKQADPDMYVRIVSEESDGIVVRGAKVPVGGACLNDEIFIIPARPMGKDEKEYAVAFAVPADAKGVIHVVQHNLIDSRSLVAEDIDFGNVKYASSFSAASLLILDDVFIPKELVFMKGETEFTGPLVAEFASIVRMNGAGCRSGLCDVMLGAAASIAEFNGVANASHIVDKLTQMYYLAESIFLPAVASAYYGQQAPSGVYLPNPSYAAVSKMQACDAIYEVAKLAIDIAGGLTVTMPSEKDYKNPEVKKYMDKYLHAADIPTEHRIRMFRLIESLTANPVLCAVHQGGGPIQAQKIVMWRGANIEEKKRIAKALAGIQE